jgi:hypothetical protein
MVLLEQRRGNIVLIEKSIIKGKDNAWLVKAERAVKEISEILRA